MLFKVAHNFYSFVHLLTIKKNKIRKSDNKLIIITFVNMTSTRYNISGRLFFSSFVIKASKFLLKKISVLKKLYLIKRLKTLNT